MSKFRKSFEEEPRPPMGRGSNSQPASKSSPSSQPAIPTNPAFAEEAIKFRQRALRDSLTNGSWRDIQELFMRLRSQGTWNDLDLNIRLLCDDWPTQPTEFRKWMNALPDAPIVFTVMGYRALAWAWEARGSGWGHTVSPENAQLFLDRLQLSAEYLQRAMTIDPEDPLCWAYAVRCCKGLGQGQQAVLNCFGEAAARYPEIITAYEESLDALAGKWFGSHALMFDFARKVSAAAPKGSSLHRLLVIAHYEKAVTEPFDSHFRTYFGDRKVRQDVRQSWEMSVGSVAYRKCFNSIRDYLLFAGAFYSCGDIADCWRELQKIDYFILCKPWSYYHEPKQVYFETQREVQRRRI